MSPNEQIMVNMFFVLDIYAGITTGGNIREAESSPIHHHLHSEFVCDKQWRISSFDLLPILNKMVRFHVVIATNQHKRYWMTAKMRPGNSGDSLVIKMGTLPKSKKKLLVKIK